MIIQIIVMTAACVLLPVGIGAFIGLALGGQVTPCIGAAVGTAVATCGAFALIGKAME